MKVKVRYVTEFGGSDSIINVKEIPEFIQKFTIISVSAVKNKKYTKKQLLEAFSEPFGQGSLNRDEYKSRVMNKLGLDKFEQFKKKQNE